MKTHINVNEPEWPYTIPKSEQRDTTRPQASTLDEWIDAGDTDYIVRACNHAERLAEALKTLASEIQLGKLNVRKDFSLLNAHAGATKALYAWEGAQK